MNQEFPFSMMDIISLLGLPSPPRGKSNYYIKCPYCDTNGKHLNINFVKNGFRCPKCGASGGVLDLYSEFTGTPRAEAFKRISERIGGDWQARAQMIKRNIIKTPQRMAVLTDVETRDATYRQLLSRLDLAPDHRQNLRNRGLSDEEIDARMYRTTPVIGHSALARQLLSDGLCLAGVPGFYRAKGDYWTLVGMNRGIMIPVVDRKKNIQGIQIRLDKVLKRKFRWLATSDTKYIDGCGAESWIHIAGELDPSKQPILLTEGPMKADVVHYLTGLTVIAVPGVNSLAKLNDLLPELQFLGITYLMTAFDMDYLTNHHVQAGMNALIKLLEEYNMQYGTYLWDPSRNGLDDYILSVLKDSIVEQ